MTFAELKQEILDIAKLTTADTVGARVARFVTRAREMIATHVRALEMVTSGQVLEADRITGGIYNLPADFLQRVSVFGTHAGQAYQVIPAAMSQIRSYSTSAPAFWFVIYGRRIEFRGAPDTDAAFDLLYYALPDDFTADGDTNDLLTAHAELYLHGALHWLYLDAHAPELAAAHKEQFLYDAKKVSDTAKAAMAAGIVHADSNFAAGSAM